MVNTYDGDPVRQSIQLVGAHAASNPAVPATRANSVVVLSVIGWTVQPSFLTPGHKQIQRFGGTLVYNRNLADRLIIAHYTSLGGAGAVLIGNQQVGLAALSAATRQWSLVVEFTALSQTTALLKSTFMCDNVTTAWEQEYNIVQYAVAGMAFDTTYWTNTLQLSWSVADVANSVTVQTGSVELV